MLIMYSYCFQQPHLMQWGRESFYWSSCDLHRQLTRLSAEFEQISVPVLLRSWQLLSRVHQHLSYPLRYHYLLLAPVHWYPSHSTKKENIRSSSRIRFDWNWVMAMKSINRFIYGPTPEEKVREWQTKLRTEQRQLDREILNVSSSPFGTSPERVSWQVARETYPEIAIRAQDSSQEEWREVRTHARQRGCEGEQTERQACQLESKSGECSDAIAESARWVVSGASREWEW